MLLIPSKQHSRRASPCQLLPCCLHLLHSLFGLLLQLRYSPIHSFVIYSSVQNQQNLQQYLSQKFSLLAILQQNHQQNLVYQQPISKTKINVANLVYQQTYSQIISKIQFNISKQPPQIVIQGFQTPSPQIPAPGSDSGQDVGGSFVNQLFASGGSGTNSNHPSGGAAQQSDVGLYSDTLLILSM